MSFRPKRFWTSVAILALVLAIGAWVQITRNEPANRKTQVIVKRLHGVHEVGPCRDAYYSTGARSNSKMPTILSPRGVRAAIHDPECQLQTELLFRTYCYLHGSCPKGVTPRNTGSSGSGQPPPSGSGSGAGGTSGGGTGGSSAILTVPDPNLPGVDVPCTSVQGVAQVGC